MFRVFGIICVLCSFFTPTFFGTSFGNVFSVIDYFSKHSIENSIDALSFKIAISVLMISVILIIIGIICFALYGRQNILFVNEKVERNNLKWKEKYQYSELNKKFVDELENAYQNLQDLQQRVIKLENTLEEKERIIHKN